MKLKIALLIAIILLAGISYCHAWERGGRRVVVRDRGFHAGEFFGGVAIGTLGGVILDRTVLRPPVVYYPAPRHVYYPPPPVYADSLDPIAVNTCMSNSTPAEQNACLRGLREATVARRQQAINDAYQQGRALGGY